MLGHQLPVLSLADNLRALAGALVSVALGCAVSVGMLLRANGHTWRELLRVLRDGRL